MIPIQEFEWNCQTKKAIG